MEQPPETPEETPDVYKKMGWDLEKELSQFPIEDLKLHVIERDGKKTYPKELANCCQLLRNHPDFKNKIRFDSFKNFGEYQMDGTWEKISDNIVSVLQDKIQGMYNAFSSYGKDIVNQAIELVAYENTQDTVTDWANTLTWDGENRLESFFPNAYNVENTLYHQLVGKNFWLGMAARILHPGCHHRFVLIIEGSQNVGKSKSLRAIAGDDWFLEDAPLPSESVSFHMALWGKVLVEFSEGAIFRKVDMEKIKSLVSTPIDTIVKKWGRHPIDIKRRCVFAITTNQTSYFSDRTGNTRFFPITTEKIDLEYIRKNREQLFAEAIGRVKDGEKWWDETLEAKRIFESEQSSRMAVSSLEEKIEEWLNKPSNLTRTIDGFLMKDLMLSVLEGKENQADINLAGSILRENGFVRDKYKRTLEGIRGRFWKKDYKNSVEIEGFEFDGKA